MPLLPPYAEFQRIAGAAAILYERFGCEPEGVSLRIVWLAS